MDRERIEEYWQGITEIEAQQCLIDLRVADYPWMKSEDKESTHEHFSRQAYPGTYEAGETLTTAQVAERLRAALNG